MALPLREPFFLRGRTLVIQRAVIVSVVLGSIAFVAGVVWAALAMALCNRLFAPTSDQHHFQLFAAAAIGCVMAVGVPYSLWLRHSLVDAAGRVVWIGAVALVPVWGRLMVVNAMPWHYFGGFQLDPPVLEDVLFLRTPPFLGIELPMLFFILWAGWSTAFMRGSRIWFVSSGMSLLSVPAIIAADVMILALPQWNGLQTPITDFVFGAESLRILAFGGQSFAIFFIPWGLPFWWPPKPESTAGG